MRLTALALILFVLAPAMVLAPPQEPELTKRDLVAAMRFLNTLEYQYADQHQAFAAHDEFLAWLQDTGKMDSARLNLSAENLKPYELRLVVTPDGKHYQASLIRIASMNDSSTGCKPAAFTDDRGVIYLGSSLGCEAPSKPASAAP
jgi:hypothetical protein